MATKKKETFEQSLTRLDEIVSKLEDGEASLDESLSLFEEGTRILGDCSKQLDEAEQKVVRLKKGEDGNPQEMPFESIDE